MMWSVIKNFCFSNFSLFGTPTHCSKIESSYHQTALPSTLAVYVLFTNHTSDFKQFKQ